MTQGDCDLLKVTSVLRCGPRRNALWSHVTACAFNNCSVALSGPVASFALYVSTLVISWSAVGKRQLAKKGTGEHLSCVGSGL